MARRTLAQVEEELTKAKAEAKAARSTARAAEKALVEWQASLAQTVEEAIDNGDVCDEAWDRLEGIVDRPSKHVTLTIELEIDWEDPPQAVRELLKEDSNLDRHDLTFGELVLEADYSTYSEGCEFSLNEMRIKDVKRVED